MPDLSNDRGIKILQLLGINLFLRRTVAILQYNQRLLIWHFYTLLYTFPFYFFNMYGIFLQDEWRIDNRRYDASSLHMSYWIVHYNENLKVYEKESQWNFYSDLLSTFVVSAIRYRWWSAHEAHATLPEGFKTQTQTFLSANKTDKILRSTSESG